MLHYRANLQVTVGRCESGSTSPNKGAKIDPITVEEMEKVGREIPRHMQKESFEKEIGILKRASVGWKRMHC